MEELKDVAMDCHEMIVKNITFYGGKIHNGIRYYRTRATGRGFFSSRPSILGANFHELQNTLKVQLWKV